MRAKFKVESIRKMESGQEQAEMYAVTDDGTEENRRFNKYTPGGRLNIMIDNPGAQGFLQPGKSYFLDFSAAD